MLQVNVRKNKVIKWCTRKGLDGRMEVKLNSVMVKEVGSFRYLEGIMAANE